MNITSLFNQCEQSTSDYINSIQCYYADHKGVMITNPCCIINNDTDTKCEDDQCIQCTNYELDQCTNCEQHQCTMNRLLYDPRIKPVSKYLACFVWYKI